MAKNKIIHVLAWNGDPYFVLADDKLKVMYKFKRYGFIAKLTYMFLRLSYKNVNVSVSSDSNGDK